MSAQVYPLMTVDDLDCMPEDGNRYEVIEGELFVSRAPSLPHQLVSGNIFGHFWSYLQSNPIGTIVATPGLILNEYSGVIPDLVFFTHQRGTEIIANERLIAAPEIAIEILFRDGANIARDRVAKRQLYSKHGVKEYWIVDSENRTVELYSLVGASLELSATLKDDDLVTSPLLPSFGFAASEVFRQ